VKGERKIERTFLSLLVGSILLVTSLFPSTFSAPPTIKRPYEIVVANLAGPDTVDPARAYDPISGELIFNVYETLVTYDGESVERIIPQLAVEWKIENITGETSPEGVSWYYRYTFKIRTGVRFHDGNTLTPEDVEYSFEREMVQDSSGGPQWMLYEPTLNEARGAAYLGNGNLTDMANVQLVGKMIDHSVESNSTHVWFNLAFPGAYGPLPQTLCQTWSSILSKQWIRNYVIGVLGRPEWNGDWGDYSGWIEYHSPTVSPLDTPTPIMDGTGPFMLETLDYVNNYWSAIRNPNYWRGWPADFPKTARIRSAGYIMRMKAIWGATEMEATMLLDGDIDFCALPQAQMGDVLGQDGIRCTYPLPSLAVNAMFFTFDINATTQYGTILPSGVFNETGFPNDFFGNATWGIHARKAFAYAFDYDTYIAQAYLGEAQHPQTAIIPGLIYYDPSVKGYTYNLTRAAEEFQQVPGLWDSGFTMTFVCSTRGTRSYYPELIKSAIESLNPKFHITIKYVPYPELLSASRRRQLPISMLGDLSSCPDPHEVARDFYHSNGFFAARQLYSNPTMDALIDVAVKEPDSLRRASIYHDIQVLAVEDCSCIMLAQSLRRHFERDWIVGWYYNPSYLGIYGYNLWKWYYVPQAVLNNSTQPTSNTLPLDTNYDGRINIFDLATVAQAFGSSYGPPIHPRWNFRADVDNNRVVDISDLKAIAACFGQKSAVWVPPS
jgi:peptide/nickel transport system substrate-binding protein